MSTNQIHSPTPTMSNLSLPPIRYAQRGFTMVEMSIVLVIIALIVGAVSVGRDVYRSAMNQRIVSDFIQPWAMAYDSYTYATGLPPGDRLSPPTGLINQSLNNALCNAPGGGMALSAAMQAYGIALPPGRSVDQPDRYVYQDSRSLPQQLSVCFISVPWAQEGVLPRSYILRNRSVMRIEGVTPELALMLDKQIDGRIDARFGKVRENTQANNTTPDAVNWSRDERASPSGTTNGTGESQSGTMTVYLLMRN